MTFYVNQKRLPKDYKTNKKFQDIILKHSVQRYIEKVELMPYQAELIKLQKHIEKYGQKLIILFDGRDASGKGGTIRRIVRYMNEKHYHVVALGKPTTNQKTELHLKRYIEHFPHAGEIVLFDRSWYNRAMVEPIFNFCSKSQYNKFIKHVNAYEENFLEDSKTILLKLYFSVSKDEQQNRFDRRKNDPLRQWKLSEVDLQAQELWDEFTVKKYKMLLKTNTKIAPWYIIRSDDKHKARIATIKLILNSVRYRYRDRKLDFSIDRNTVLSANREIKLMKKDRKKYGKFIR